MMRANRARAIVQIDTFSSMIRVSPAKRNVDHTCIINYLLDILKQMPALYAAQKQHQSPNATLFFLQLPLATTTTPR